jgi:hypothetical protein
VRKFWYFKKTLGCLEKKQSKQKQRKGGVPKKSRASLKHQFFLFKTGVSRKERRKEKKRKEKKRKEKKRKEKKRKERSKEKTQGVVLLLCCF